MSKAAKDLVKKMLQKLASNRITASEALADPWIRQFHRGGAGANSGLTPKGGAAAATGVGIQKMGSPTQTVKPLCISALTQLKNFHCERKLQQAVLAYIANSMNTK